MHAVDLAFAAVAFALFIGAILQGCIGFGMVVLAFPVLITVDPSLLPQSVLVAALPTIALNAVRNWGAADYREVSWLMVGRVPGLIGGLLLVHLVARSWLAIGGGLVVLAAVGLSIWTPQVRRTIGNLLAAGAISALFGTAIGIGGPPLGLLYQHESGRQLRSTITALMITGAPVSLLLLALTGQVSMTDAQTGVALAPFTVAGTLVAPRFMPWFDERVRLTVLVVCAFAALVAITRVAFTL